LEWYHYIALIIAGLAAGFINTVAGSGSLITLPLLIYIGLPANVANGTNRIGILFQTLVGVGSFQRQGMLEWRQALIPTIPAVIGAIVGAQIAVDLNELVMRRVIGVLMVFMLVLMIVNPDRWLREAATSRRIHSGWLGWIVMFGVGLYGGFIQVGIGVILLAGLVLGAGYDLVRANAVKLLIVLCYTPFAIAVFIRGDQVAWAPGLILAIGSMAGAWIAARMAVQKGVRFVRWFLIVVVVVSAVELLGVVRLVREWLGV
jgi:hypothetical protein